MKRYDYLIVGSGLFGATFAHEAMKRGKSCLVIDKRPQLGGNIYCEPVAIPKASPLPSPAGRELDSDHNPKGPSTEGVGEAIINVHKYGAHIFHTSNKRVWDYVNRIVEFNRYTNSPVANYKGELYNLPFNMNTFNKMWPDVHTPAEAQAKLDQQRKDAIEAINKHHRETGLPELEASPRGGWEGAINLEEQALCLVGKDIFYKLIKEYTEKQWGRDCKELPAFIIKRLPVRLIFDNNYFNDKYQGIPIGGYNKLIDGLLNGAECRPDTDFFQTICPETGKTYRESWGQVTERMVYTGAVDEYFDYRLGRLDWRTVSFKTRTEDTPNYQGNAVVNYTSHDEPYTRVIEHKHFEMFGQEVYDCPKTIVSEEYSTEYKEGMEPYYPVNNDRNNQLAEQYRQLAEQEQDVLFGGRLGQYKYYDMAPVIEQVLQLFDSNPDL